MSDYWFYLIAGPIALFVALAIHEAGHLAAGSLVGFRMGMMAVGPIGIVRAGRRFLLRWLPPSHWGPFAFAYPVTLEGLRPRVAWYVAGGPIASLTTATVLFVVSRSIAPSAAGRTIGFIALLSACVFVATAQPFGTGIGIASDGARFWSLMRNTADARLDLAMFTLAGQDYGGVRPREWKPWVLEWAATTQASPAYELVAATVGLRRAIDVDDARAAQEQVQRIRAVYARVPRMLRGDAAAASALWLAQRGNDLAAARVFLKDTDVALAESYRRWIAEAAVLSLADAREGARTALDRAQAALSQGMGQPSALDRELVESMAQALE